MVFERPEDYHDRINDESLGIEDMAILFIRNVGCVGYPLTVKGNRNRAPVDSLTAMGAHEAASLAEMAARCDIVFLCLSTSAQVEAVIRGPDGLMANGRPGLIVVDTTTANPVSTEALAAELDAAGMHMVDAPLGRTPKEAEAGTLDAMVRHHPQRLCRRHRTRQGRRLHADACRPHRRPQRCGPRKEVKNDRG
mgnify:CR=1 FL=1